MFPLIVKNQKQGNCQDKLLMGITNRDIDNFTCGVSLLEMPEKKSAFIRKIMLNSESVTLERKPDHKMVYLDITMIIHFI